MSTSCFLTSPRARRDHQLPVYRVDNLAVRTFAERFEYMLEQCKIDRATLARTLSGPGQQQKITNWLERGRIGGPSRKEISTLTGISTDWLNDATGPAFPQGPRWSHGLSEDAAPYDAGTPVFLSPRELALIENYRASPERFRRAVDDQVAASAESGLDAAAS